MILILITIFILLIAVFLYLPDLIIYWHYKSATDVESWLFHTLSNESAQDILTTLPSIAVLVTIIFISYPLYKALEDLLYDNNQRLRNEIVRLTDRLKEVEYELHYTKTDLSSYQEGLARNKEELEKKSKELKILEGNQKYLIRIASDMAKISPVAKPRLFSNDIPDRWKKIFLDGIKKSQLKEIPLKEYDHKIWYPRYRRSSKRLDQARISSHKQEYVIAEQRKKIEEQSKTIERLEQSLKRKNQIPLEVYESLKEYKYAARRTFTQLRIYLKCQNLGLIINWDDIFREHRQDYRQKHSHRSANAANE